MTRREGGGIPNTGTGTGTVSYCCSVDLQQQVGQRVRCDVEGIGTLEHTIVAGEQVVDYVKNGMDGLLQPPAPAPAGVRT